MKHVVKIAVCLASGLALNAGLCADNVVLPNNPYAPIVARNIFHLKPPQAADAATDANPPPKITPTGIMTIFGTRQALFTVDGVSKAGQPGKNESYILSEGQRQDDVEVTRINEKSGVVTFKNHGTVQEIPLVKAPVNAIPAPVATAVALPDNRSGIFPRFGNRRNNGNNSNGTDGSSNLRAIPPRSGGSSQQSQQTLTPEAQIIAMEVSRQLTADQVRSGEMPPLPPTPLTPPDAPGYISPPPIPGQ
jgi:hypothetical protein